MNTVYIETITFMQCPDKRVRLSGQTVRNEKPNIWFPPLINPPFQRRGEKCLSGQLSGTCPER